MILTHRFLIIALLTPLASACATTATAPSEDGIQSVVAAPEAAAPEAAVALQIEAPATGQADPLPEDSPAIKALSPAERSMLQLHVMTGELAAGRKQPETATREFLKALEIVEDAALAQRATSMALAARNEDLAMQAARQWHKAAPNEVDPREVIARLALNKGDLDEAYEQCAAIVGGSAGGADDGFRQVTQILSLAGKKQGADALKIMQRLTTKWMQMAAAQQSLAMLALRYDDLKLADFAARQALTLEPDSRESLLLLAGVRVRQKQFDEAGTIIDKLATSSKDSAELRLGYARLLLEAGQRERARDQLKQMLAADPANSDALYALGVLAYNDRNLDEAAQRFEPMLKGPRSGEAAFQLGRIEELRKNYPKALEYYGMVRAGPQALDASVRSATVMARSGDLAKARTLMQSLRDQLPQFSERLYLSEAEILSDAGKPDDALNLYRDALKEMPDSTDLLYGRSLIHERQNRIDLAEQDLRAIIKIDADEARSLNALGYMLTVHTKRLKEARELIARAHELEPEDAAIMDSLGWVQYKLGDKAGARDMLNRALDRLQDPEIAAHYGEVLWALGEKDQAITVWNKALASDPEHRVLKETVQRLNPR